MAFIYNRRNQKDVRRLLRNNMPQAEVILWSQLQRRNLLGHKFHRQYGIGPYIADFYCRAVKLDVELDGDSHYQEGAKEYDRNREQYMEKLGIQTVRILNDEVFDNLDGVIEMLGKIVEEREKEIPGAFEKRGRRSRRSRRKPR